MTDVSVAISQKNYFHIFSRLMPKADFVHEGKFDSNFDSLVNSSTIPRFTPAGFLISFPVASSEHCLVLQKNEAHYFAVVQRLRTSKRGGALLSIESIV